MKIINLSFVLTSLALVVNGQFVFPNDDGVDYDACLEELTLADANQDNELNLDEYENFVQAYQERILASCNAETTTSTTSTTTTQDEEDSPFIFTATHGEAFRSLACMCRCQDGYDCCTGDKAHVDTNGSEVEQRSWRQHYYLSTVCQVTDGSITVPRCSDLVAQSTSSLQSNSLRGQSVEEEDEYDKSSCAIYTAILLGGLAVVIGLVSYFVKKKRAAAAAKARSTSASTSVATPKTLDSNSNADDESTVAASVLSEDKA